MALVSVPSPFHLSAVAVPSASSPVSSRPCVKGTVMDVTSVSGKPLAWTTSAYKLVGSGGHCRQREVEVAGSDLIGVQVVDHIHCRPADGVEVHDVVVVGDEVVELARAQPAGIDHFEIENVAGLQGRMHLQRFVDV